MQAPLHGIRVLDFSAVLSGPLATALLADQGADVVKVEPPGCDLCRRIGPAKGTMSAMFIAANRGKRSLVLDLKRADHVEVVCALAARADVLVENFRPGTMARLGLDPVALQAANPRLVVASITGFGASGPYADGRVYDAVIQAVAGISASHPAQPGGAPTLLATAVCDKLTALTAAQGITAALLARERDGLGPRLELSMLDAALTPQPGEFGALCRGLGRPELAADPRFATIDARRRNCAELLTLLDALIAEHDTDELVTRLRAAGVPMGRVNQRHEALADPQVRHNGAVVELDHGDVGRVRLARMAARFPGFDLPPPPPRPAPRLGEHNRQVLGELGFDEARIGRVLRPATAREEG